MIVLLETKDGKIKKAFIRNQIFQEVDDDNKKIGTMKTDTINGILWPAAKGEGIRKVEVAKWLEMAEAANFWGLN